MRISDIIMTLNRGETAEELEERLRAVVGGVQRTGCAGVITFTLKIEATPTGEEVIFTPKITAKIPAKAGCPETWVASPDGEVEPKQLRLSIDMPPRPPRPPRKAAA